MTITFPNAGADLAAARAATLRIRYAPTVGYVPTVSVAPATARCTCGGYLTGDAHRTLTPVMTHTDRCADCLDGHPAGCEHFALHRSCDAPEIVTCEHTGCITTASATDPHDPTNRVTIRYATPAAVDGADCANGFDACCGCCHH